MPMSPRLLRPIASSLDPDAAVYLNAVAAADGEQLEPAVKKAVNDFVRGCKQDGIWSAIKASCLLAGPRTLAGALVPLVGTAPSNNGPFVAADYNRATGLVGNGTTKYLATGRNLLSSDSQDNHHAAVFPTELPSEGTTSSDDFGPLLAARASGTAAGSVQVLNNGPLFGTVFSQNIVQVLSTNASVTSSLSRVAQKFFGLSRSSSSEFVGRGNDLSSTFSVTSQSLANADWFVFARTVGGSGEKYTKARIAFYSIGESLDLALLDTRVSAYITAIGSALAPNYADADVNAYIAAVEQADGGLILEQGVRDAYNDFIVGCKSDGIWDSIKSSCILAGARTLAGALVPLVGAAPSNNGPFVAADYDRATGLVGNGSTKYLDSNRANNADPQNDQHLATYVGATPAITLRSYMGAGGVESGRSTFGVFSNSSLFAASRIFNAATSGTGGVTTGFCGISRSQSENYTLRNESLDINVSAISNPPTSGNIFVFARENNAGDAISLTDARLAFYSIGESLDLALLDTRVSSLITAIGAAV